MTDTDEGEPMPDEILNGPGALDELFAAPVEGGGVKGDTMLPPAAPPSAKPPRQ